MLGHTAAWKVTSLSRQNYKALKTFAGSSAALPGTIARLQIEAAVRTASEQTGRTLRIVRSDIVDATDTQQGVLPVIGTISRDYTLERGLFTGRHSAFEALETAYAAEQQTVHSTVVAEIVKRHVRNRLAGFSLRDHGGVYFVPSGREQRLFDLEAFLERHAIGRITRIRVMGDAHETKMLTEEIKRIVEDRLTDLRERLQDADLSDPKETKKALERFRMLRNELAEMRELFGFAREEIQRQDARARRTLAKAVRRANPGRPTLSPSHAPTPWSALPQSVSPAVVQPLQATPGDGAAFASGNAPNVALSLFG